MPKVVATQNLNSEAIWSDAPEGVHILKHQSDTNYLHGDGLFPVAKDINGRVEPGTGLSVKVLDYLALVDGVYLYLGGKRNLSPSTFRVLDVSSIVGKGKHYILLSPKVSKWRKSTGEDEDVKLPGAGELYLSQTVPSDGAVVLASIDIPSGTTQVTQDMIDESEKKYLADIDKAIKGLRSYIDEAVERAKREIYDYIINQLTPQIRDEIAQGDAAVRAELDAKIAVVQSQIDDLNVSVETIRQSLADLQSYINEKIANLEQKTDELTNAVNNLQDAVEENRAFLDQLYDNISKVEGDIVSIQLQLEEHLRRIEQLEQQSTLQQGIFDLGNAINIAKTNWRIQQIHQLSVNELYKGYTDILKDLANIDTALSSDYFHNTVLQRIEAVRLGGLVAYWKFDEGIGNIALDSMGTNHGIIRGATWTAGKVNNALYFNGIDNRVEVRSRMSTEESYSIEFWFKAFVYRAKPQVMMRSRSEGNAGDFGFLAMMSTTLWGHPDNEHFYLSVMVPTPAPQWVSLPGPRIPLGEFTHVVFTYDAMTKNVSLYVNGTLCAGTVIAPVYRVTDDWMAIGSDYWGYGRWAPDGQAFNGVIDEVRVYNRALTADEVLERYNLREIGEPFTPGIVITKPVNYGITPVNAVVPATLEDVTVYISRDNGTTWTEIIPDTLFTFTTEPEGRDIRLKFVLNSPDSYIDNYAVFVK